MSTKREKKADRKKREDLIMKLLAEGAPVEQICKETGLGKSVIYDRRARFRSLAGKAAEADILPAMTPEPESESLPPATPPVPALGEQDAPVAPAEASMERLVQAAFVAGVGLDDIASTFDIDLSDISLEPQTRQAGLLRKSQVLAKLQAERPAQWLAWKTEQETAAAKRLADKRVDKDRVLAFLGDIISHQARLLTEDDMRDWVVWVEELAHNRYPELA